MLRVSAEASFAVEQFSDASAESIKQRVLALDVSQPIDGQITEDLQLLWRDRNIQLVYRRNFHPDDALQELFENLPEISQTSYVPIDRHISRGFAPSELIRRSNINMHRSTFELIDVGGLRQQRKKWIHCFENVDCVVFFASLPEYDQVRIAFLSTELIHFCVAIDRRCSLKIPVRTE